MLEAVASLDVSRRYILAVFCFVFLGAAARAAGTLRSLPGRSLRVIAAVFVLSVVLVAFDEAAARNSNAASLLQGLLPTLSGWTAFFVLLPLARGGSEPVVAALPVPRPVVAAGLLVALAMLLALVRLLAVGSWAPVGDETMYFVQSRWIRPPHLALPLEQELADFFRMRKVDYTNGYLYGMYPPGWPALLAAFRTVGLEWWSGVILGATSAVLMYQVARRLFGPAGAAIAAVLLATSQYFLMLHAGYMAHAPAITAILGAALCMLIAEGAAPARRAILWFAAGVLLGYVVVVRPLSGLTMGTSIGLWMLVRLRARAPRLVLPMALMVGLGGLPPAAFLLWHNHSVYGELLAVGYSQMSGGVYDLGFGPRGVTVLDSNLVRQPATFDFTPRVATSYLFKRAAALNTTYVPVGLLLPLIAAAVAFGFRIPWSRIAIFALLPAAHLFYWYAGIRLYSELLPFLLLAVTAMLLHLRSVRPQLATAFFATLVASSAVMYVNWPRGSPGDFRRWADYGYAGSRPVPMATLHRADSLGREHGKVLLFVRDRSRFDNLIGALHFFNGGGLDGPVLVARDLGERNAELVRRVPDRVPYLVLDRGRNEAAEFLPLGAR